MPLGCAMTAATRALPAVAEDKHSLVWAPAQASLLSCRHKGAAQGGGCGAAGWQHGGVWASTGILLSPRPSAGHPGGDGRT